MQVINLLNRQEFEQFKSGHTIQTVGNNPLIAFDSGRAPRGSKQLAAKAHDTIIDVTPRKKRKDMYGHFPCTYCEQSCTTKQALGGHIAAHRRKGHRKLLTHVASKN